MRDLIALYRELLDAYPPGARHFLNRYAATLGALAVFDAAALGLLALVIGPVASGYPVSLPIIGEIGDVGVLIAMGCIVLLTLSKGAASVWTLYWATRHSARYELELGQRLFRSYMQAPWITRLNKNSADIVRLTDTGVSQAVTSYSMQGATLIGEAFTLTTIVVVLGIAQPAIGAVTLVYLGSLGFVLYFWIQRRSREAGRVNIRTSLYTSRLITEMVGAMKELTLRGKNAEVEQVIRNSRSHTVRARANAQFLGQLPRFVLEAGIIGGFVLVGAVGFWTGGAPGAMTGVALFGLAGFRMAPSVVRFQVVTSTMANNRDAARRILDEIRDSERALSSARASEEVMLPPSPHVLRVNDISFRYPSASTNAVDHVSIDIEFGKTTALVGASGSGKSTMVDLLLGLLTPSDGQILVDDTPLSHATTAWRKRVGYVPQDVSLFDATVAQNVALCWDDSFDRDRVRSALDQAQMLESVEARAGGLDAHVGERGLGVSGGQRQRLGIARALYADPAVLVLDEATSALDTATESAVTESLHALHGEVTLIVVAHRLATVKDADQIAFMREGQLIAVGTFDYLVNEVPDFAQQAALAGLLERGVSPLDTSKTDARRDEPTRE
ncbi:MAG: ABC transporter ATP-binding protein [Actinobacteria bacterium HGW-Actinobacteria-8]|nr:MAG: ABC transporter ATP-binding protein [Actinobacteria bacterium HGW-Actinobacteria-8]